MAPRELLVARGQLSETTLRALKSPAVPIEVTHVSPGCDFPTPEDILSGKPEVRYGTVLGILYCERRLVVSAYHLC